MADMTDLLEVEMLEKGHTCNGSNIILSKLTLSDFFSDFQWRGRTES